MLNLWVQETYIDATDDNHRCGLGESGVYETGDTERSTIYHASAKEFGRCIGKVYIGDGRPIGWVFVKRRNFDDSPGSYLQETWITVHSAPDTVTGESHYA